MNDLKGLKLNEIEIKESDLDEFAKDFVTKLSIPSVIGFNGSLGAGKTSIIKKIIYHLGIEDNVTSPTFNIVKNYLKEDLSIYHVDLYRLSSFQEFIDLDLPLFEENTLFFVEWSNQLPNTNLSNWTIIDIDIINEHSLTKDEFKSCSASIIASSSELISKKYPSKRYSY